MTMMETNREKVDGTNRTESIPTPTIRDVESSFGDSFSLDVIGLGFWDRWLSLETYESINHCVGM